MVRPLRLGRGEGRVRCRAFGWLMVLLSTFCFLLSAFCFSRRFPRPISYLPSPISHLPFPVKRRATMRRVLDNLELIAPGEVPDAGHVSDLSAVMDRDDGRDLDALVQGRHD